VVQWCSGADAEQRGAEDKVQEWCRGAYEVQVHMHTCR